MTVHATLWSARGSVVNLACGQLSAEFDLHDFIGVHGLDWAGSPLDACILRPELPHIVDGQFAITESYVRGDDFVVSCERPAPVPLVPQFYWRARRHEPQRAVGVELILSMRTDLLDSQPETRVQSLLDSGEALMAMQLEANAFRPVSPATFKRVDLAAGDVPVFLFRVPGVSYFQMVHPDDFFAVEFGREHKDLSRLTTTLFPERLEKGVIRRGRICGWFLPVENDLEVAVELARQFIDEPLPLTA